MKRNLLITEKEMAKLLARKVKKLGKRMSQKKALEIITRLKVLRPD